MNTGIQAALVFGFYSGVAGSVLAWVLTCRRDRILGIPTRAFGFGVGFYLGPMTMAVIQPKI